MAASSKHIRAGNNQMVSVKTREAVVLNATLTTRCSPAHRDAAERGSSCGIPLFQVRRLERAALLLDDVDVVEAAALDARDGVHGDLGELLLLAGEDLRRERRARDAQHRLAQRGGVRLVVLCALVLQDVQRGLHARTPPVDDHLRVDLLVHQLLRLAQQLARKHADGRRPVADFFVRGVRDVHEHLCRRVVEVDPLQDRRAVVRDLHVLRVAHAQEDLVHPLRTERRLNHVRECRRPDERRLRAGNVEMCEGEWK